MLPSCSGGRRLKSTSFNLDFFFEVPTCLQLLCVILSVDYIHFCDVSYQLALLNYNYPVEALIVIDCYCTHLKKLSYDCIV